jgi:hypothetical protein
MNLTIDDTSDHKHFFINDVYKLFVVENVSRYSFIDYHTHEIEVSTSTDAEPSYYFVIDLLFHDAFSHWVYESAIYLPIFKGLKEMYPNVKLVLNGVKKFKTMFLHFFKIDPFDIVYQENMSTANVCFFPSPISSLNDNDYFTEDYKKIICHFIQQFHNYTCEKKDVYDCIIMPRQTKENYVNNDRQYDMTSVYHDLAHTNYHVLHTDKIEDLTDQIQQLRSSSKIILTDGSPFLVNNMFCLQTNIQIVGRVTEHQFARYVKVKYISDTNTELNQNTFEYISPEEE